MPRFVRGKKFKRTDGFPTIQIQKIVDFLGRFGTG